jgi:sugar phosphate isomerase/epimerase
MTQLASVAETIANAGGTRMNTWIMPTHDLYTYNVNFKLHRDRLKEAANIIGHYGIRLGLEYVGPKTLMVRSKYSFIRTMAEAKELIAAMDEPNVGFILDSFHWYCAGESKTDILTLENKDIVAVDLNDARTGFSADEQTDGKRELPMATGVIPIKDFLEGITQIGYDGPVRAEPFNQPLRDMDDEAAVKATYEAMKKAIDLVG